MIDSIYYTMCSKSVFSLNVIEVSFFYMVYMFFAYSFLTKSICKGLNVYVPPSHSQIYMLKF